ncbi:MAG: hypothetical protein ABI901_13990 [Roseiflexaceae bacterium]
MPFRNRVSPFGEIVATTARGTLMGNRGCLHDQHNHPLRQYQGRRWIICVLDFKGRTRQPMPPGHYTSLFFLDEATALAAGHRPCAECQRERFNLFRAHWAAANPELAGSAAPLVATIDTALHHERISDQRYQRDKIKLTYSEKLARLPDGVFVVLETSAAPYLVRGDQLVPWNFTGYGRPIARHDATVQVLTPRSIVRAIAHGYAVGVHPSALRAV